MLGVRALRIDAADLEAQRLRTRPPIVARDTSSRRMRAYLRRQKVSRASEFGKLMNASHASLRDDYEVSVPPFDPARSLLQECQRFTAHVSRARDSGAPALPSPAAVQPLK